jgi:hypothetical protein
MQPFPVTHVVLLRPKPSLSVAEREALLDAMKHAFTSIAEIRRVRIGKRRLLGRQYEAMMTEDYEFLCVIEFDDEEGLRTYLDHPAHAELGRLFYASSERALVYDFEMVEPGRIRDLL